MKILGGEENFFGIDLGSSGVRVVQLKNTHGKPSLLTYGDIATPPNLINSDSAIDQEKMAEIVRRIASEAGVSARNVVAALPTSSVFTTTIKTPRLSPDELNNAIRLQADKYIPMPIDQVKLDWVILNENEANNEMDVFLVAAPISVANKYLNIIQKAGYELLALETNSLALIRSLVSEASNNVVIIDFGASATDITVVSNHTPRLIRSVNIGARALIRVASQNLGLDETQAIQFITKFGLTQDKLEGQVYKSIKPVIDNIVEEINKSIEFIKNSNATVVIEKLIMTGGLTGLPELPVYLANATGLTVEIGNPWVNISYPANLQDKLNTISLSYAAAIGLAMRREGE